MDSSPSSQEVDPAYLPPGTRVGPWCVRGWGGRGAYGTVYRVEREGHEQDGSFALKLAHFSRDPRFTREVELLSRIQHPHVPRLKDHGVWHHRSGAFPYVVMEWIEGTPLYEWAEGHDLTGRQALRVLAQMARALEATHAAGAVHRDVKGDNILVRLADAHPFLTDFGAGHFRGAATLTSRLLPPGTAAYRSPEAWAFVHAFARHPTVHYPASACDDLFALGVTAYRLVTRLYPPPTHPQERDAEVWREGGPGPHAPRLLNSQVGPELDALILRLLSIAPVERFNGQAREAAEALEQAERSAGPEADLPLFPREASSATAARAASPRPAASEPPPAPRPARSAGPAPMRARAPAAAPARVRRVVLAACVVLLAALAGMSSHQGPQEAQLLRATDACEGGSAAVGDSGLDFPIAMLSTELPDTCMPVVGLRMPDGPFPGQRTPPCSKGGEEEIRGGCWYGLRNLAPPCKDDAYEWQGACYLPSYPPRRRSTSGSP
ncbi:MAG: serine/threonine-protein kinase [Hyalangium sp.]|uniref:serine/threonine-protein kinase n=1 Tax=Hyalangium sp. TaxID=2028555 RepID=UPI00389ABAF4